MDVLSSLHCTLHFQLVSLLTNKLFCVWSYSFLFYKFCMHTVLVHFFFSPCWLWHLYSVSTHLCSSSLVKLCASSYSSCLPHLVLFRLVSSFSTWRSGRMWSELEKWIKFGLIIYFGTDRYSFDEETFRRFHTPRRRRGTCRAIHRCRRTIIMVKDVGMVAHK